MRIPISRFNISRHIVPLLDPKLAMKKQRNPLEMTGRYYNNLVVVLFPHKADFAVIKINFPAKTF